VKKFLEDLKTELTNKHLSKVEIEEIIADHEQMITEAIQEGLSEEEIIKKFGSPEKIAEDCSEFAKKGATEVHDSGYVLYQSFPVITKEIDVLVHFLNEDIEVVRGLSNQIEVLYKGKEDLSKYTIEFTNGVLTLKAPKTSGIRFFSFRNNAVQFLIKLPDVMINNFTIHSVDADASLTDLNIGKLDIKTTNGDFNIKQLNVDDLKLDTVNGDVTIDNYSAKQLNFSTISGDVALFNGVVKGNIHANSVSGDVSINNGKCQEASFTTVSGDIDGKDFYPNDIALRSVSGDITIKNSDCTRPINIISKKSVSGEIKIV